MKLPLAVLLLLGGVVTAPVASADAGVNLSWDACSPEGGVQSKTFACNTNTGTSMMVGSFILSADQPNFVGAEITIDIQAQSDSLPSWWQFKNAGTCRQGALSLNFSFGSDPNTSCTDPWSGQATGGIGAYLTYWTTPQVQGGNANSAQFKIVAAVPSTVPMQLTGGTEYYCFKLAFTYVKTVGSGACDGCSTPVCIVLSGIRAVQNDGTQEDVTSPIVSNILSWQSGETCSGGNIPQNVTWGQIRSVLK